MSIMQTLSKEQPITFLFKAFFSQVNTYKDMSKKVSRPLK